MASDEDKKQHYKRRQSVFVIPDKIVRVFRRKKLVIRLAMSAGGLSGGLAGWRAEQACQGHNFSLKVKNGHK
ncbi:hypothetical protein DPMN_170746 [Dreissena polymorpha]|uniref:Uncharacterized protein n=1 Tax=Dreissena polymorpha TaxID=45954 RepID=A0A9D4DXX1_DREPO|nr:hypothetical protein DPMN_170746 [Dreissena polymorpha]